MNICRQCQKQFDDNVLFCPSCGNKLEKQNVQVANNIICQKCGNTLTSADKFCPKCGEKTPAFYQTPMVNNMNTNVVNNNQPIQPVNQLYQQNMNTNFNVNNSNNSADGILNKIKNEYFCFEGRINRKFYITRSLIIAVVVMVLYFIIYAATTDIFGIMSDFGMMLTLIVQLVGTVAGISLNIRRFHDFNKSGWWILIFMVPFVNLYFSIKLLCIRGDVGTNNYGVDPF